MMDCVNTGNDMACNGGDPWDLYYYIEKYGLETNTTYPEETTNEQ